MTKYADFEYAELELPLKEGEVADVVLAEIVGEIEVTLCGFHHFLFRVTHEINRVAHVAIAGDPHRIEAFRRYLKTGKIC